MVLSRGLGLRPRLAETLTFWNVLSDTGYLSLGDDLVESCD